jgi:hypothetical protein
MGGHKKNKRGSIPSSMSSTSKTEMIERTPENDYGVLSDPEENGPSSPVHHFTEETEAETESFGFGVWGFGFLESRGETAPATGGS